MASKFFTNHPQNTIFEKFQGILNDMQALYAFYAVIGYFRSSGYFALQPYLKEIKDIKILVGINVDKLFSEAQKKGLRYVEDRQKIKEEFSSWFVQDTQEALYTEEVEKGILDFIQDLIDGKIEVRAHNSQVIHAKFYLFLPEQHTEHSDGWVIMGSSNLTEAGLGIKKSSNYELNIALKDYDDVQFTVQEFEKLWQESTKILPHDIQNSQKKTYIGQEFTPFEMYLKLLIEYFGDNIDYDPDTVGDLPLSFKKLSYQIDAVNEGFQMLSRYNGFFLSDVVGLGKTVIATMIAKRFLIANGSSTKLLVIFPPALEKNWKETFKKFKIDKHAKFITNGRLNYLLDGHTDYWEKEEYDVILVDEAHKYRNSDSKIFDCLQKICKSPRKNKGLISGERKKVILISATPLNNRPDDLKNQLLLFQDARRSTLPITNLQNFFGPIIKRYQETLIEESPDMSKIQEIYTQIREKIISPITVRRTRKDLQNYPKYIEDLESQGITFPKIAPLESFKYDLNDKLGNLFDATISSLITQVGYFRYQAIAYLQEELKKKSYSHATLFSTRLASIMKILLIKRLESSFHAFKITLQNILKSTEHMIEMFENDKVLIAPSVNINYLLEKGNSMEEIESLVEELSENDEKHNIFTKKDFQDGFLEGLQEDQKILQELVNRWGKITQDPKLDQLIYAFKNKLLDKKINPTGKAILFTESNDTAEYLETKLTQELPQKILKISAKNRSQQFETVQKNFDANYEQRQENTYQILITTDAFSEGVNLHRANVIINYDTPWNATRLMQRIGRINRIGSTADTIYSFNFYPSEHGDNIIRLHKTALIKLQGFHSAFGEDNQVYTKEEMLDQFELFKEGVPSEEDKRIEYLRLIREFKEKNPQEFKRIQNFPLKARSIRQNSYAKKEELKNSTIIFLKSSYKTEFYKVSNDVQSQNYHASALTFLEVAQFFEATQDEKSVRVPATHYKHVQAALDQFKSEFNQNSIETVTTIDKADATSKQANKFLRNVKQASQNKAIKVKIDLLIKSIHQGRYTQIPKKIKKLAQQLKKKQITLAEMEVELNKIAQQYNLSDTTIDKQDEHQSPMIPDIIISETFVP